MGPIRTFLSCLKHPLVHSCHHMYGKLPPIPAPLKQKRHCFHAEEEAISCLLLWSPSHHLIKSRKFTCPALISRDIGIKVQEMNVDITDREVWQDIAKGNSAEAEGGEEDRERRRRKRRAAAAVMVTATTATKTTTTT